MKAEAIAWMAGRVSGVAGWREAWCLREKRARKRWARGVCSEQRAWRWGGIGSVDVGCGGAWNRVLVSVGGAVVHDFFVGGGCVSSDGTAVGAIIG